MKLLLLSICAVLFSVVASNEASEALQKLKAEIKTIATECAKENGATDADVNNFLEKIAPESHAAHCMLFCVGKQTETFDANGLYNEAGARAFFEPLKNGDAAVYEKILAIAARCEKEVTPDADHCTTAANFYQCSLKAEKEMMG